MQTHSVRTAILVAALVSIAQYGAASAQAPATPLAGAAVDTCAMLAEADVVAIVGKLTKPPKAETPTGSLLGGCDYNGAKLTATLTAHPADELDGTVRRDLKKGRAKAISGLGEKAYQTEYGVMFQQAGKPYFLVVFAVSTTTATPDPVASEALARKVK